jgi:hypothetical protein
MIYKGQQCEHQTGEETIMIPTVLWMLLMGLTRIQCVLNTLNAFRTQQMCSESGQCVQNSQCVQTTTMCSDHVNVFRTWPICSELSQCVQNTPDVFKIVHHICAMCRALIFSRPPWIYRFGINDNWSWFQMLALLSLCGKGRLCVAYMLSKYLSWFSWLPIFTYSLLILVPEACRSSDRICQPLHCHVCRYARHVGCYATTWNATGGWQCLKMAVSSAEAFCPYREASGNKCALLKIKDLSRRLTVYSKNDTEIHRIMRRNKRKM